MMQPRTVGCKVAVEVARKRGAAREHCAITVVEPDCCAPRGLPAARVTRTS